MDSEFQKGLDLIRKLLEALSYADSNNTEINRRLVQEATIFLGRHTAAEPRFE